MTPLRIEEAALNSWPALRQVFYDGWLLRLARGYTKRANSVNPIYGSHMDLLEKVEACERFYRQEGQPCLFRLTGFSHPPELDRFLDERGYQKTGTTLVLHRDLEGWHPDAARAVDLREVSLDDWMVAFEGFVGSTDEDQDTHRNILAVISLTRVLALLVDAGLAVACGVGVIDHGYLGLFDIVTDPRLRGRGYGTRLVGGLLDWARDNGARHAYLQVVEENEPAIRVYGKFGFQEAYQYWYRVQPSAT